MKEERFKVIQLVRQLILHIDNNLDNFPKKDIEIKNRIRNLSFDILEKIYEANFIMDMERKKYRLEIIIAKIKTLDFLVNLCYDKQIINNKRYLKFGEKMDDIIRYTSGWLKKLN